ncbi:MAG: exodeoxyribonuclease VII small subunit [Deltaproteobacteria bacterium]
MKSFEDSLSELREIIEKLENANTPLEESLGGFQRGVELISECRGKLDEARRKIAVLTEAPDGRIAEREFEAGD